MPRISDADKDHVRKVASEAARRAGEDEAAAARTAREIEQQIKALEGK